MNAIELLSSDLVRLALVLGMILSVFLYEKSHLTTGSIVIPGFLGVHVFEPLIVLTTIFNAWICFLVVHQVGPKFFLMKSKYKFQALIVVSVLLQLTLHLLNTLFGPLIPSSLLGFGFLIPGLLAHDMSRNGAFKTAMNTLLATSLVGACVVGLLQIAPEFSQVSDDGAAPVFKYDLVVILLFGTLASVALRTATPIRSGGYVTAAFVVFFGANPFLLASLLVVALMTHLICTQFLMPRMIVFGRRKFAMMLIVGSLMMWAYLIVCEGMGTLLSNFQHPAYAGILILLPGLIANDMHRSDISNVLTGMGLLVSWVFLIVNLYYEIRYFARPEYTIPLAGLLIGLMMAICVIKNTSNQRLTAPTPVLKT